MSRKSKLVLKAGTSNMTAPFTIVKTVNTLEHGVPGQHLTREEVDKLLKTNRQYINDGRLTVEFVKG